MGVGKWRASALITCNTTSRTLGSHLSTAVSEAFPPAADPLALSVASPSAPPPPPPPSPAPAPVPLPPPSAAAFPACLALSAASASAVRMASLLPSAYPLTNSSTTPLAATDARAASSPALARSSGSDARPVVREPVGRSKGCRGCIWEALRDGDGARTRRRACAKANLARTYPQRQRPHVFCGEHRQRRLLGYGRSRAAGRHCCPWLDITQACRRHGLRPRSARVVLRGFCRRSCSRSRGTLRCGSDRLHP